jgi:hypothetical protein
MGIKISRNVSHYLIIIGVSLGLSILFQIYWLGMTGTSMNEGGGAFRLAMKICSLCFIYAGLYRFFSVGALEYNIALKLPLLYYFATVIVVMPFIYTNAYRQAINILFFAPLLLVDFSNSRGRETFRFIIKVIVIVVVIHLLLDGGIKFMNLHLVRTLLGGMGNANTFGLYLIVTALAFRFIYHRENISRVFLLLVAGTGSLVCSLIAFMLLLRSIVDIRLKNIPLLLFLLGSSATGLFLAQAWIFNKFNPIWHAYMKFQGLIQYVLVGGEVGSASISVREEYTIQALSLLSENPMALIFGHPDFMPFYSGDGFFIALLVTLGLPITLLFFICNLIVVYRGFKENDSLSIFSAYVVLTFLVLFLTNRILDYWPAGLIYMLTFSYLVRKRDIGLSHSRKRLFYIK